jgi:MFS family permease
MPSSLMKGSPMSVKSDSRDAAKPSLAGFWLLTSAASFSDLGNAFLNLALPTVILARTGSPLLAALSLAADCSPYVFAPALGTLIDRYDRRRVFLVSELAQAVLVALLPSLLSAGQIAPTLVLLLFVGCGGVISGLTSDFSLLPMLVPPDRVSRAYSRYGTATATARCIGPAAAGVMMVAFGWDWALWIDAVTFLGSALVALVLPRRERPPAAGRGFLRMQVEGFQSFRRIPAIRRLTLALSLLNLGAAATPTIMVVLAEGSWHWSAGRAGLIVAAGAAGSALGSWLAGHVFATAPVRWRIGLWFAVSAGGCALLLAAWPMVVITGACVLSAGTGGMNVTTNEYRFSVIPPEVAGRVNAVMRASILGAASLSSLILGWSLSMPDQALRFAPALLGSAMAAILWLRSPDLRPRIPDPRAEVSSFHG